MNRSKQLGGKQIELDKWMTTGQNVRWNTTRLCTDRSNIEMSVDGKGSKRKRAKLAREAIGGKNDRDSNSREVWDTQ